MSQENVASLQRLAEAWNANDRDAFLAELDADVEWHPSIEPGLEGRRRRRAKGLPSKPPGCALTAASEAHL